MIFIKKQGIIQQLKEMPNQKFQKNLMKIVII